MRVRFRGYQFSISSGLRTYRLPLLHACSKFTRVSFPSSSNLFLNSARKDKGLSSERIRKKLVCNAKTSFHSLSTFESTPKKGVKRAQPLCTRGCTTGDDQSESNEESIPTSYPVKYPVLRWRSVLSRFYPHIQGWNKITRK